MRSRPVLQRNGIAKRIAVAGISLALIASVGAATTSLPSNAFASGPALSLLSNMNGNTVERNPYTNEVQGYSLLIQGDMYGISEQYYGAGQTAFYLIDSIAETDTVYGSLFTLYYYPGYTDSDEYMTDDEFFTELLSNVKETSGDSFVPATAETYGTITLAGVSMPATAWSRQCPDSGLVLHEISAREILPDGSAVIWSMSAVDEEFNTVLQGFTEAIATFKTDPAAYGAAASIQIDPASLSQRQAGSTTTIPGSSSSGTGTVPSQNSPSASSLHYTAVEFSDGKSFTMKIPEGWRVSYNGGAGLQALVEAYDPSNPAIRMGFWATQEVPASKNVAAAYGIPFVMQSATMEEYVKHFPEISTFAVSMGDAAYPIWTRVTSCEVIGSTPMTIVTDGLSQAGMDWMVADESIVLASMTLDDGSNTPVIVSVYGTVIPTGFTGFEINSIQLISIVVAPADVFEDVAAALVESGCYGSFEIMESYARSSGDGGIAIGNTGSSGSNYDSSSGTLDSYYYQQAVQDSTMQAWDDYILGRDRYTSEDGTEVLVYYE